MTYVLARRMPIWAGAALLLGGCAGGGTAGGVVLGPNPQSTVSPTGSPQVSAAPQAASKAASPTSHSLADVKSWTQPTDIPIGQPAATLAALTAQTASLLILDPALVAAAAGTDSNVKPLSLLHQNSHRRVLAVLDISEITTKDPRWQAAWVDASGKPTPAAPAWLEAHGDKASGVYPVQYWNAAWQALAGTALDKIVADGYDGVSLQGVGDFAPLVKSRHQAAEDMAGFVETLSAHARKTKPAFSVLSDGGASLPVVLPAAASKAYLDAVDGVLAHDVFYPGGKPMDNELAPDETLVAALGTFQKAGESVFVTERLTDPDKIADLLTRAHSKGYIVDSALCPPPFRTPPRRQHPPRSLMPSVSDIFL